MKIIWISSFPIPDICRDMDAEIISIEGWKVKLAKEISKDNKLLFLFPYKNNVVGKLDYLDYRSFYPISKNLNSGITQLKIIFKSFNPDLIHIHGTEHEHSYAAIKAASDLGIVDNCVISIQGLVSVIAKHYYSGLDYKVINGFTFRDLIKGNIKRQKKQYEVKGKFEIKSLQIANHVIGRTCWDKTCTNLYNSNINYHFNNEMLRDGFYISSKWDIDKCKKHTIFVSQGFYPIKGLHLAIEALNLVKNRYPDVKMAVAGYDLVNAPLYKKSWYGLYIISLIKKYDLKNNISFIGNKNEQEMINQYLDSNVFIMPSTIENSPNSLCEAQYLGVPVISSMVGGVQDLVVHGETGFYYQHDAPYMLAYYIEKIFADKTKCIELSKNEIKVAEKRHNIENIKNDLLNIYYKIGNKYIQY